jgi:hypothetical protein
MVLNRDFFKILYGQNESLLNSRRIRITSNQLLVELPYGVRVFDWIKFNAPAVGELATREQDFTSTSASYFVVCQQFSQRLHLYVQMIIIIRKDIS